jgi:hypothetical protein
MSLLITRPDFDPATKYLSAWSEKILNIAREKGQKFIDLRGKKVTKRELVGRLKKLNPRLVILNGHGSENSIAGQDNEILIEADNNESLLHNRITYAVSCNSGKTLGPMVAENENTAFIGYDDDFVFTSDRRFFSRPLDDKRAKPFMEASNHVAISLLKGHKVKVASERSKELFKKSFQHLLSSKSDADSLQDARFLWWNMKHQVCLGDVNAIINCRQE